MLKDVGTRIRRVFFINGPNGPTDFFQGVIRSVTAANKYDVVYDDYDEKEMGEAEIEIYKMKVKDQVVANWPMCRVLDFGKMRTIATVPSDDDDCFYYYKK